MTPFQIAFAAALVQLGGGGLVLVVGDRPARWAAVGLLANVGLSFALQDRSVWLDPTHRLLVIDIAFLALLTVVALRQARVWLITATALQLLAAMSDAVIIFDHVAAARAWLTVTVGFGWGVFACVMWGGYDGWRRQRRREA